MIEHSIKQSWDKSRWIKGKQPFDLICDSCGRIGVREGTFQECKDYQKKWGWKSKSIRTNDSYKRYLWSNLCRQCSKAEWKESQ